MLTPAEARELELIAEQLAEALARDGVYNDPALQHYNNWQTAVRIRRSSPPASDYCD